MSEFPEHDKLKAVREDSQKLGSFLEWLQEQGWALVRYNSNDDPVLRYESTEETLAKYFEIDLNELENEKQAMLEQLRRDGR